MVPANLNNGEVGGLNAPSCAMPGSLWVDVVLEAAAPASAEPFA